MIKYGTKEIARERRAIGIKFVCKSYGRFQFQDYTT